MMVIDMDRQAEIAESIQIIKEGDALEISYVLKPLVSDSEAIPELIPHLEKLLTDTRFCQIRIPTLYMEIRQAAAMSIVHICEAVGDKRTIPLTSVAGPFGDKNYPREHHLKFVIAMGWNRERSEEIGIRLLKWLDDPKQKQMAIPILAETSYVGFFESLIPRLDITDEDLDYAASSMINNAYDPPKKSDLEALKPFIPELSKYRNLEYECKAAMRVLDTLENSPSS